MKSRCANCGSIIEEQTYCKLCNASVPFAKIGNLPFNKWSRERIKQGRKICTSRTRVWNDERVKFVVKLPLYVVRNFLWKQEGADSPEEFEAVWRSIHRGNYESMEFVYVHFGNFKEVDK